MEYRDYLEFKNINIFELNLFTRKLSEGNFFTKNNIYTLEELFNKDDNGTIIYGDSSTSSQKLKVSYLKGLISLLRFKYLNEELTNDNFTETYFKNDFDKFTKSGMSMGLNESELERIFYSSTYIGKECGLKRNESVKDFFIDEERFKCFLYKTGDIPKCPGFAEKCTIIRKHILLKERKNKEMNLPDNMKELLEEEKSLLLELARLNEESSKITNRLFEIQELKESSFQKTLK